jgi:hypothetical protein
MSRSHQTDLDGHEDLSDKKDKRIANRRHRKKVKHLLRTWRSIDEIDFPEHETGHDTKDKFGDEE